jgi:hypothetical protein
MLLADFGVLGSVPYHLSFATRDLDLAMARFTELFDLRWSAVAEGMEPGLGTAAAGEAAAWRSRRVISLGGPVHYELSEGSPGSIWHTDALATLHHLAYWTTDLRAAIDGLVADGWERELTLFDDDGGPKEFAYVSKPGWPRLELVDIRRQERFVTTHEHLGAAAPGPTS